MNNIKLKFRKSANTLGLKVRKDFQIGFWADFGRESEKILTLK